MGTAPVSNIEAVRSALLIAITFIVTAVIYDMSIAFGVFVINLILGTLYTFIPSLSLNNIEKDNDNE